MRRDEFQGEHFTIASNIDLVLSRRVAWIKSGKLVVGFGSETSLEQPRDFGLLGHLDPRHFSRVLRRRNAAPGGPVSTRLYERRTGMIILSSVGKGLFGVSLDFPDWASSGH